jgi:membrane fusion protein
MRQLFRQEAIDAQREKFLGDATIARPVPFWVFTLLAAGTAVLLIAVALWGQYTRRERVEGYLALDTGAARVLISDSGRLTELLVKEGDEVKAGDPMAKVSLDRTTGSGASTSEAVTVEMQNRRAMLEKDQERWRELGAQQVEQLRRRVKDLENEIVQLDREMKLQQTRVRAAKEEADRYKSLAGEKFVSEVVSKQKLNEVTDQEIKLQALRRQRSVMERDLAAARLDEPAILLKTQAQVEQASRQISELQEGLAQAEAKRESVIRAPMTGVVTNIAVNRGQSVAADAPFATVLPKGSGLHVELLSPRARSASSPRGRKSCCATRPFPFERFGQYRGSSADIGRNVWTPGERIGTLTAKEPVYRVDVNLERQAVARLGRNSRCAPACSSTPTSSSSAAPSSSGSSSPVLQLKGSV